MKNEIIKLINKYQEELLIPIPLDIYVEKISSNANIINFYESKLIAFIAFYCNDINNRVGFITMILVDKEFQKKGIGQLLLDAAINRLQYSEFSVCELKVLKSNRKAIDFYKRNMFEEKGIENDFLIMERKL